jgi:HD-GYP domain-containing protein (c-di-GMP phosphodiesterase class II)
MVRAITRKRNQKKQEVRMTDQSIPSVSAMVEYFSTVSASRRRRRLLLLAWVVVSAAVLLLVGLLHARTIAQEEMHISRQLQLSSSQRAEAAAQAVRAQQQLLEQVASNVSVQLYMTQLKQVELPEEGGFAPERQYLENLLLATAMKGGFQPNLPADAMVNANVTPPLQSGIALLDDAGNVVAATRAMPPVRERLEAFLKEASNVNASASEPVKVGAQSYVIYFQAPIFAVQSEAGAANFIGRVVGARLLDGKFLQSILGEKEDATLTALVVPDAEKPQLLTLVEGGLNAQPLPQAARNADGSSRKQPVELAAIAQAGSVVQGESADGKASFAIAPKATGTELQLLQELGRAGAMKAVYQDVAWLWLVVVIGLIGFGIFLWAMVRHSVAVRSAMAAEQYQALAARLDTKSRLLELVTQHTPSTLTILDDQGRVCFTNWKAPAGVDVTLEDAQGKTLIAMLGADAAKTLLARSQHALDQDEPGIYFEQRETAEGHKSYQCTYLPLETIPVHLPFLRAGSKGVLIVEDDISQLVEERERKEQTLRRMVDCLVDFVDRRDPYAARHSAQVAILARAIASTMRQPEVMQETAELAGKLLNVGKMQVPEDVLAQAGSLNPDVLQRIREAITSSADVVEGIAFRGPVAETIRQSLERVDGKGPQQMKGDEILESARVVAVANAFVGMTSPRAYRAPLSAEAAIEQMMKSAGSAFDAAVVAALVHYLETYDGHAQLAQASA